MIPIIIITTILLLCVGNQSGLITMESITLFTLLDSFIEAAYKNGQLDIPAALQYVAGQTPEHIKQLVDLISTISKRLPEKYIPAAVDFIASVKTNEALGILKDVTGKIPPNAIRIPQFDLEKIKAFNALNELLQNLPEIDPKEPKKPGMLRYGLAIGLGATIAILAAISFVAE